ncbi:MAG: hypothetical protein M3391_11825 [Actinomycetota bacterium]|nr:hypothetical protein [Actinomycetota bacterium]
MKSSLRRVAFVMTVVSLLSCVSGSALARWNPGSSNTKSYSQGRTMPAGNTPTASVTARNVAVSWSGNQFPAGTPLNTYVVTRYDVATNTAQTMLSNCNGIVTGTTCTEQAVPPGDWRYTVTPVHQNWAGPASSLSTAVTVQAPSLTLNPPTTFFLLPGAVTGSIANYASGQTLSFRLDDPNTGTVLSGSSTPSTIGTAGSATISATIPTGTSNGTHTIYAIGSGGDVASASITVNVPVLSPTSLLISNGGNQTGRPQQGDRVEVGFNQAIDVASMCSTWSGNGSNQSIAADNAVTVTILDNAAASGNDLLNVSTSAAACGGAFNFGSVDVGSPNFVSATTTFSGAGANASTVAWNATTYKLTVTLGARVLGVNPSRVNAVVTSSYTPSPALLNPSGHPAVGIATSSAIQF